jgi:hypothetical protein
MFDRLLIKYIAVWLWSILFGTSTGVLYSFLGFRYDRWGGLGLVLLIPSLLSLVAALLSWFSLYNALRKYLLPKFFSQPDIEVDVDPRVFAIYIRQSFYFFVMAAFFRAVAAIIELLLASAQSL